MKTFYCVKSEIDQNGEVLAGVLMREHKVKPENIIKKTPVAIVKKDWFETELEAVEVMKRINSGKLNVADTAVGR